jgi:hypothetical protein
MLLPCIPTPWCTSYAVPETGLRQTILMCSQRIFPALVIFKTERTYARRFFGAFSKSSSLVSASLLFIGGELRKNGPDWQKNPINAAEGTGILQK